MKRKMFLMLFSLVLLVASSNAFAFFGGDKDSPWNQKLPFKEGTITYAISGTETGSQIAYIKDYGRTIARYRNSAVKVFGFAQNQETIQITTPDFIYNIDVTQGSGSKTANPQKFMIKEYEKLSSSDKKRVQANAKKNGTQLMNGSQVSVEPCTSKILGYKCDVASISGGRSFTFRGTAVELKTDFSTMGMKMVTEATEISKGSVPEDKFLPPKGISIEYDQSSEEMYKNMARQTIANLVEGKSITSTDTTQYGGTQPPTAPQGRQPAPGNTEGGNMEQNLQEMMKGIQGMFGN